MRRRFIPRSDQSWGCIPLDFRREIKSTLIERYGLKCVLCSCDFEYSRLTIDHIYPISMGGPVTDIDNMRLLCNRCHRRLHQR